MEASEREENEIPFPCIENPFRVSLFCNGRYLWCLNRRGKLGARRRRAMDKDEFQLIETGDHVMLVNHQFGSVLSVIEGKQRLVRCVVLDQQGTSDSQANNIELCSKESTSYDGTEEDHEDDNFSAIDFPTASQTELENGSDDQIDADEGNIDDNENEGDDDDDDDETDHGDSTISVESQKWELIKHVGGYIRMKNIETGDCLGIDDRGKPALFAKDDDDSNVNSQSLWRIEPATGELCFLSNVTYDTRIRCDMRGGLSTSSNWKGWEVFRFVEAGSGFVRIVSWVHSQWMLRCNATGELQTGTQSVRHSEEEWDFLWAVERATNGNGVVIRSSRYGRFLCIQKADSRNTLTLGTYHLLDERPDDMYNEQLFNIGISDMEKDEQVYPKNNITPPTDTIHQSSQADLLQQALEKKHHTKGNRRGWFRRRVNDDKSGKGAPARAEVDDLHKKTSLLPSQDVSETIVWRLEAAHLQHYFLSSINSTRAASAESDEQYARTTKSVGPFPKVTSNLRSTDKFHLIRKAIIGVEQAETSSTSSGTTIMVQLYHLREKQYVACSCDGKITLTKNKDDESTEWILVHSDALGGSSFQSRHFGYFLSYGSGVGKAETIISSSSMNVNIDNNDENKGSPRRKRLANLLSFQNNKKDEDDNHDDTDVSKNNSSSTEVLNVSQELGPNASWDLEPCVPRAVNSKQVRSFAIGTSLVIGSSFALPFALVGAGAMLHIGGNAGMAYHLLVAGISSADAVSSVGAVGATAYVVFRGGAQDLSLTDQLDGSRIDTVRAGASDEQQEQEEQEARRKRLQRPFCDWRNW